ncbi:phosphoribosylanthranilate isomerase [Fulvivirga sp. RKSG066]|uniref:phosphoribosylanthranilate isomerase n=1 Tax=Fulvivirga aurantia TaxID=2529383 RepID=UPI0012BC4C06|nr:phosphoribosylanthranilate isomerase [Fulvivirga aurantia]MTI22447.1 phosphoribosylanthranilate isomerase [Fulvivirga aurantia]
MALKTFVLISSVNNLSDARYCAGMDVDLIGFNMEKESDQYISPETYAELTEWLSGVEFVGEFDSYDQENIISAIDAYKAEYIEVKDPAKVAALKSAGKKVILRQNIDSVTIDPNATYLVLEGGSEELSETHLNMIKDLATKHKVLIGFGINDNNVEELIEKTGAHGIALRGGEEIKPGYKDYDELADILEALEIDDLA